MRMGFAVCCTCNTSGVIPDAWCSRPPSILRVARNARMEHGQGIEANGIAPVEQVSEGCY